MLRVYYPHNVKETPSRWYVVFVARAVTNMAQTVNETNHLHLRPQGRQTAGAMGMIEFLFCILRLACARHINASGGGSAGNGGVGGGGGGVAGESGNGSSKIKWASRRVHCSTDTLRCCDAVISYISKHLRLAMFHVSVRCVDTCLDSLQWYVSSSRPRLPPVHSLALGDALRIIQRARSGGSFHEERHAAAGTPQGYWPSDQNVRI